MSSEVNPEAARIECNTANQLKDADQLDAASIKSDSAIAPTLLAEVYYVQGKLENALALCHQALKINPDNAEAYKTLGNILHSQGKIAAAIRSYLKAIELQPNGAAAYVKLGSMYFKQGQLDAAISCYQKVIELNPDLAADAYFHLGIILRKQGRLSEAAIAYQKAIAIQPDKVEAHFNLGNALFQQGQREKALSSYQRAIQLKPDLVEAHFLSGNALFDLGQFEKAVRSYQRVCELQPNYVPAYFNLGLVQSHLGQLKEVVHSYQQAIALQPNLPEAHFNLGNALFELGKVQHAANSYRQATQLQPDFAEAHFCLGNVLLYLSQFDEAISSYKRAIQIRPDFTDAHINLVYCLADQGSLEAAIACCHHLLQIKPELANIYLKQRGYTDEALAYYDQKLPLNLTKKVCKSTRNLAATSKSHNITYIDIHPPSKIPLSLPMSPDGNIHERLRLHQGESPETFVVVVPDGRAWGERYNSLVITSDNQLLADISTGTGNLPFTFCLKYLPPAYEINGTVAFLSVLAGAEYYHWMTDVLPRIELLRRSGIGLDSIDNFVINDYRYPFQKETLLALDIPETKILTSKQHPHIKANKLVVPSVPTTVPKWVGNFIDGAPKWVCNFLRDEFLPKKALDNSDKPERIYISRQLASRRRVINEDEAIALLNKFGFISVTLESMSVAEQVSLLANAKVVVAPHGAGLTNLVFCTPGIMVIEFFSPRYVSQCYWVMSNRIGLEYYYLLGESLEDNFSINPLPTTKKLPSAMFEDILIDLDSLLNILRFAGVA